MVYQQFASLYDDLMQHAPYDRWIRFTKQAFNSTRQQVCQVIDLGCGTGELTTRLAHEGYEMIGVDYSSDMLALAEQKAMAQQLRVRWIKQDLRQLSGFKDLDAAISYCDVINYITDIDDCVHVFDRIASCLKPRGLFIFDVHACDHVEQNLIGHTFADANDDVAYIWQCLAGDEPYDMYHELTFFAKEVDGRYQRFDEYHHQRTYPVTTYTALLTKAGFKNIQIYTDFDMKNQKRHDEAERIFFIAEKGSGTL